MSRASSRADPPAKKRLGFSQLWAMARKNVQFLGCFADYAKKYPQYADKKHYQNKSGTRQLEPGPADSILPPSRDKYTRWQDGPTRMMRSLEDGKGEDPRQYPLYKCLWRCYNKAMDQGYKYFALQDGGLCFGSNDDVFSRLGKLPERDCYVCTRECQAGTQPCGTKCIKAGADCQQDEHSTCAVREKKKLSRKGPKSGGYFTNAVWRIKDTSFATQVNPDENKKYFNLDDEDLHRRLAKYRFQKPNLDGQRQLAQAPGEGKSPRAPKPLLGHSEMDCPDFKDNLFDLSPAQLFGAKYFTPDNVLKLFLLWHGAGAGKTCEMLNIMVNFLLKKWNIFWITRKSLRGVPTMDLYQNICQTQLRQLIESKNPIVRADGTVMADDRASKIAFIRNKKPGSAVILKRYGANFDKQRIMTYGDLVDVLLGRGKNTHILRQQMAEGKNGDPLRKTLILIDEAHNINSVTFARSEEAKQLNAKFKQFTLGGKKYATRDDVYGRKVRAGQSTLQGRDVLAAAIFRSYELSGADSVKLVMATATPMIASPVDFFWLLNLGIVNPRERLSLRMEDHYNTETRQLMDVSRYRFAQAAVGRLSYLELSKDPTRFSRRTLAGVHAVYMHPLHDALLQAQVQKAKKAKQDLVQVYRDYGLLCQDKFTKASPGLLKSKADEWKNMPVEQKQHYQSIQQNSNLKHWAKVLHQANFEFIFYHKKFNPDAFRDLMPVYAPKIYALIRNIIEIEKRAVRENLPGKKHTVFTFSESGKGVHKKHFGAKAIASAFLAFPNFRLLADYRKVNGKTVLHVPSNPEGKWGVAMLTLNSISKNNGYRDVQFDSAVINATQQMFNADGNNFGQQAKVLIIEKPFKEGVSAYNVSESHFLQPGLSVEDLDQASARSSRVCRSKALPYYPGVGAFTNMHFYPLYTPRGRTLYQEMLDHVPVRQLRDVNLIPDFRRMGRNYAIDEFLNSNINDFDPEFEGRVAAINNDRRRTYQIQIVAQPRSPEEKKPMSRTLCVDPEWVVSRFNTGDVVATARHKAQVIGSIQGDKVVMSHTRRVVPLTELRYAVGQRVVFRMPSGIEMAKKLFNMGRTESFPSQAQENPATQARRLNVSLPKKAVDVAFTSFRGTPRHILLGLLTLLRILTVTQPQRSPVHIVLPDTVEELSETSAVWSCSGSGMGEGGAQSGPRQLAVRPEAWASFLAPTEGLSFMMLMMRDPLCPEDEEKDGTPIWHSNLLLYVPAWKTIERFDPLGVNALYFDSAALDMTLKREIRIRDPDVLYINAAQSNVVRGLQQWQERERKKHNLDTTSFNFVFVLFYMHARLMYASEQTAVPPDTALFPLQFQQAMVRAMLEKHPGRLTEYIRAYAQMMVDENRVLRRYPLFDPDKTFQENLLHMVKTLSAEFQGEKALALVTQRRGSPVGNALPLWRVDRAVGRRSPPKRRPPLPPPRPVVRSSKPTPRPRRSAKKPKASEARWVSGGPRALRLAQSLSKRRNASSRRASVAASLPAPPAPSMWAQMKSAISRPLRLTRKNNYGLW